MKHIILSLVLVTVLIIGFTFFLLFPQIRFNSPPPDDPFQNLHGDDIPEEIGFSEEKIKGNVDSHNDDSRGENVVESTLTPPEVLPNLTQAEKTKIYLEERHCSTKLLDSPRLGIYKPLKCNKTRLKYLDTIISEDWGIGLTAFSSEVIGPDKEALCFREGEPKKTFTYVRGMSEGCICDLLKKEGPDLSKRYMVASHPYVREFQGLARHGMEILYLPKGKVNFLTTKCLKNLSQIPDQEHYFRKLDPRVYLSRYLSLVSSSRKLYSCMPQLFEMRKCPHERTFQRLSGMYSIERKKFVSTIFKKYAKRVGPKCYTSSSSFIPMTYDLNEKDECDSFWKFANSSETAENQVVGKWMVKQADVHEGKGVFLMSSEGYSDLKTQFKSGKACGKETDILIQEYIINTLLLEGKKFDLRTYMLIGSCSPKIVYGHPYFYARQAVDKYDPNSTDATVALTNRSLASRIGIDTAITSFAYDRFQKHFYDIGAFSDPNWMETKLYPQLYEAMAHLGNAWKCQPKFRSHRFHRLHGVDFLLTTDLQVKFIEANPSPGVYDQPWRMNTAVTNDVGKIVAQKIIHDPEQINSQTIDPGRFELVFDDSLSGTARFGGHLGEVCDDGQQ